LCVLVLKAVKASTFEDVASKVGISRGHLHNIVYGRVVPSAITLLTVSFVITDAHPFGSQLDHALLVELKSGRR